MMRRTQLALAAYALMAPLAEVGLARAAPRPMTRAELRTLDPIVPPAAKRPSRSPEARRALAAADAKRERRRLKRMAEEARHAQA